jgi:hypothetical protein
MADNNLVSLIVAPVVIAALVGGTAPWWVNAFFKPKPPSSSPETPVGQPAAISNFPEPRIVASNEFFLGRWRVEQEIGSLSGVNEVDYYRNGTFEGQQIGVSGNQGQKFHESGHWELDTLSDRSFRLKLFNDNGTEWTGTFKILDQNHIHNIDENYVAERVE